MNYFKPISISLSPNVEKDDAHLALNLIIRPWLWKQGKAIKELEANFKKYLGIKHAISFNSGRSALFAILKSLNLEQGTDVFLQAFTCNAAINPVLWQKLNPVYVDCSEEDFNMGAKDLKEKLGQYRQKERVLMVQHTFGMPADMNEFLAIAKEHNLILIEDAAHALGAEFNGRKVGNFGKASFFSFSRDKVISCVYGGMAVTNDDEIAERLKRLQKEFGMPPSFFIFQQLLHPILLRYLILPIYNFLDLGKIILVLSQIFHVLSKAVIWKEKKGGKPDYFPRALPNALAILAQNQLQKLEKFNSHRRKLADFYYKELQNTAFALPKKFDGRKSNFLRFTIKHKDAHLILYNAWHKQNILLGDWYTTPIAPADTDLDEMRYKWGKCPVAEKLSKITLNLPTHINIREKEAKRIVEFLKKF